MQCKAVIGSASFSMILLFGSSAPEAQEDIPRMESTLRTIEGRLDRIIEGKKFTSDLDVEALLEAYIGSARRAAEAAIKGAQDDIRGGNPREGVEKLARFERTAKQHVSRTESIQQKVNRIYAAIVEGTILIDLDVIRAMGAEEKQEMKGALKPSTIEIYERMQRGIIGQPLPASRLVGLANTSDSSDERRPVVCGIRGEGRYKHLNSSGMLDAIWSFFVPRAEAAMAASCAGVCVSPPWGECLACVGLALGLGSYLYTELDSAFKACERRFRWKWLRKACKGAVVATYLSAIA